MMVIVLVESDREFVDPDSPHPLHGNSEMYLWMEIDPLEIR